MNLFGAMYDKTMIWSKHRFAPFWLSFVSFIEAIFFPIPPDVMLIPMSMSKPQSAMKFAWLTAIASVLGGMIGYALGYYAFDLVEQYITQWGYQEHWQTAIHWFEKWGILVVFILVAKLAAWGGEKFAAKLRKSIEIIGWAVVVLAVIAYLILR